MINATIMSFFYDVDDDCFKIECIPSFDIMTLHRTNPNFIKIYNKLKIGNTYNFTCSDWIYHSDEIVGIRECELVSIDDVVIEFLDLQNELPMLKYYDEIVLENNVEKRLLINKNTMTNIIVGTKYKIQCIKKFGDNFYSVIDFQCI
jgi:hypothetical protein